MRFTGLWMEKTERVPQNFLDCLKPEPLFICWLRKDSPFWELHISSCTSEGGCLPKQIIAFSILSKAASSLQCAFPVSDRDTSVLEGVIDPGFENRFQVHVEK